MQGSVQEQPGPATRRVLDFEDYLDILRRHRSWIIGPAFLGVVAGVVIAFLWPDTFEAYGQMRVRPPAVPQRLGYWLVRTDSYEARTAAETGRLQIWVTP